MSSRRPDSSDRRDHGRCAGLGPVAAAGVLLGWSAVWRAGRRSSRRSVLKDGHQVTGEVVAEKPNALYVDLGFDILRIPRDQSSRGKPGEAGAPARPRAPRGSRPTRPGFFTTGVAQGRRRSRSWSTTSARP